MGNGRRFRRGVGKKESFPFSDLMQVRAVTDADLAIFNPPEDDLVVSVDLPSLERVVYELRRAFPHRDFRAVSYGDDGAVFDVYTSPAMSAIEREIFVEVWQDLEERFGVECACDQCRAERRN